MPSFLDRVRVERVELGASVRVAWSLLLLYHLAAWKQDEDVDEADTPDGWAVAEDEDVAEVRGRVESVIAILESNPKLAKTATRILRETPSYPVDSLTVALQPDGSAHGLTRAASQAVRDAGALFVDRQILNALGSVHG